MHHVILIFLGGGCGAVCRHYVGLAGMRLLGTGYPWGTLAVNVLGSFLIGVLVAWFVARGGSESLRLLLVTGFLGGFTTFSAFSLDVASLWERGQWEIAAGYVATSVVLSVAAVFAGLWAMRTVLH